MDISRIFGAAPGSSSTSRSASTPASLPAWAQGGAQAGVKRKRPGRSAAAVAGASAISSDPTARHRPGTAAAHDLWSDKHAPATASASAVFPGALKRTRQWLLEACQRVPLAPGEPPRRLLVVAGTPGGGKSTTVRLLAKELELEVVEWNDNFGQVQTWRSREDDHHALPSSSDRAAWDDFPVPYKSQLDQFQDFLHASAYSALNLTGPDHGQGRGRTGSGSGGGPTNLGSPPRQSVLLLDTLPTTRDADTQRQFRALLARFLQATQSDPAVLVFSQVVERNEINNALERLLGPELLTSPLVQRIDFPPVTERKISKRLREILRLEKAQLAGAEVDLVSARANGDLRRAIAELQFRSAASGRPSAQSVRAAAVVDEAPTSRMSSLHAIAKLLHSKHARQQREQREQQQEQQRERQSEQRGEDDEVLVGVVEVGGKMGWTAPALGFVAASVPPASAGVAAASAPHPGPEQILDACDMAPDTATGFIQHNCIEFYTDETELAAGLQTLSDADLFVAATFSGTHGKDSLFPECYVTSLASRAVSASNEHPNTAREKTFQGLRASGMRECQEKRGQSLMRIQHQLRLRNPTASVELQAVADMAPYLDLFAGARAPLAPAAAATTVTGPDEDIEEF